jgi:hypothetical protein
MIPRLRPPLRTAALVALILLAVTGAFLLGRHDRATKAGPAQPPTDLLVLTGLPLLFPDTMSLSAPAPPAAKALRSRYRLTPISVADSASLKSHPLLFMAQSRAQPPEDLVALDDWVRAGGKVLLLADPALQWPTERPLGDPLGPPFAFADTGLLAHWGLTLEGTDDLGSRQVKIAGETLRTRSPGALTSTSPACSVEDRGLLAECEVGKGRVIVIADCDFLAPDLSEANHGAEVQLLLALLGRLEW